MQPFRLFAKPLSVLVLAGFIPLSIHAPMVRAELVGTDMMLEQAGQSARQHIDATLKRQDLRSALQDRGVKMDEVQARVAALTDQEATQLAQQIDQAPAGGDGLGVIVFLFLLLLFTDILCLTHVFPFTSKRSCR